VSRVSEKETLSASETVPIREGETDLHIRAIHRRRSAVLLFYHRNGVEMAPLSEGRGVVVGREPPADLIIQDSNLSRRHASFTLEAGEVVVRDLGSKNGVRVAGQRVEQSAIKPGDDVQLGAVTVAVHATAGADLPPLGLDSHDAFRAALDAEVVRARFFGRTLAVISVRALKHDKSHLRHWCPRVRSLLRPVDRVALYSADSVEIVFPEVAAEKATEIARAIVAPHDGEPRLVCGIVLFPGIATSADELVTLSREAAREATADNPVELTDTQAPRSWSPGAAGAPQDEDAFMAKSAAMRSVVATATRLAKSAIPVLLYGETGTGKEVLSRLIHDSGPRRDKPMVCVNCAGIPAQLVESTLFGHERGSFTGASQLHKGVFEAADGGTLLLDEVGELSAATQAALLRVLETKRVMRVGSTKEVDVDVRILAATHRDLEAMCEAGSFRQDLYFRLSTMTLKIPPLRDRSEDIAPLAARFLKQACKANDSDVRSIDRDALSLLERYAWPGNVRELRSAIERAVVIAEGETISAGDLPDRIRMVGGAPPAPAPLVTGGGLAAAQAARTDEAATSGGDPEPQAASLKDRMESIEADLVVEALRAAGWNQTEAARRLNLPLRTLQHKIKALGIKKIGYKAGDPKPST
jgi:DNA-binding NtrC family response regulator